jgi:uncharacterized SAM-binding protein YcdF (DUF218 family)
MSVNEKDMVRENRSMDTADQAKMIAHTVGRDRLILVTSAIHMPRAIALFRKFGLDPVPAPTNYLVVTQPGFHYGMLFPGSDSLHNMEAAVHEYLGLIWMQVQR